MPDCQLLYWPLRLCSLLLLIGLSIIQPAQAQFAPTVQWDRAFGGSADDDLSSVEPTADGGYLLGGWSRSGASGDKTRATAGRCAYWIVKVDSSGTKLWEHSYGSGSREDEVLTRAVQTPDGGYLLAGSAYSGASGDKNDPGRGQTDYWVVKLDAQGNKLWDRAYGGSNGESLGSLLLTPDGGFLLLGVSDSNVSGDKTQPCHGIFDLWLIKLDAQGNKQWDHTLGGAGNDGSRSVALTPDGGYIIGATSDSGVSGDKSQPALGPAFDYWVIKLDAQGRVQWDRTFGGPEEDQLIALQPTADGGYVLGGASASGITATKSQPARGLRDIWVIKLNAQGHKLWDVTLGGTDDEWLRSLVLDTDGGYVLGGLSASGVSGERTQPSRGGRDGWLLKLSASGQLLWDQVLGGNYNETITALVPLRRGGYLVGASSDSGVSGDKTQPSKGGFDYWLLQLGAPRISGDARLCAGGQVQLTAPAGAVAYQWSTGGTGSSIVVGQPGVYTVTLTGANGVTATLRHQVTAFNPPPLAVSGDTVLCPGRSGQVAVGAPGATGYRWNTGATTATIAVAQPGTYTVTAFFGSGCSRQQLVRVRQLPALPPLSLGADTTFCEGQTLVLRAPATPGLVTSYRWSDGSTAATLQVQVSGTYSVQLSSACDTRTISRRVIAGPCLTVPNVVTPNGDGLNDRWKVQGLYGTGWYLEVFDRWGRKVYQTNSYTNDWGADAVPGVYYYLLRRAATNMVYKGWIEVAR